MTAKKKMKKSGQKKLQNSWLAAVWSLLLRFRVGPSLAFIYALSALRFGLLFALLGVSRGGRAEFWVVAPQGHATQRRFVVVFESTRNSNCITALLIRDTNTLTQSKSLRFSQGFNPKMKKQNNKKNRESGTGFTVESFVLLLLL